MKICNHTKLISFFIFFVLLTCASCSRVAKSTEVKIIFENEKAVALTLLGPAVDESSKDLHVRLIQPGNNIAVLGSFAHSSNEIRFEPLVPLTNGLRYEIIRGDSVLARIEIPMGNTGSSPSLLTIYPTADKLPENLLKVYLKFSEPMVEGNSLRHIFLLKDGKDTMKGTFLDLQPELWNNDGTVLTLWLDPGRIKRDLIPNKELGTPLVAGTLYTLQISDSWKSKKGISLSKTYTKNFATVGRDEVSPDISNWKIVVPKLNTSSPLEIQFYESLDQFILEEGTHVVDLNNKRLEGIWQTSSQEQTLKFIPQKPWNDGTYIVQFERRLEDLAGNNLDRPFDRNLDEMERPVEKKEFFLKEFEVYE
jgi:hypothetical protein